MNSNEYVKKLGKSPTSASIICIIVGLLIYRCEIGSIVKIMEPLCGAEFFQYYLRIYIQSMIASIVVGAIFPLFVVRCWLSLIVPPLVIRHVAFVLTVESLNLWPPILFADVIHVLVLFGIMQFSAWMSRRIRQINKT